MSAKNFSKIGPLIVNPAIHSPTVDTAGLYLFYRRPMKSKVMSDVSVMTPTPPTSSADGPKKPPSSDAVAPDDNALMLSDVNEAVPLVKDDPSNVDPLIVISATSVTSAAADTVSVRVPSRLSNVVRMEGEDPVNSASIRKSPDRS